MESSGSDGDSRAGLFGVLALQGAFKEHVDLFSRVGVEAIEVRTMEELARVDALVIPGGESTAISLIARRWGLIEPLKEFVASGKPVWGTCAGMILLANEITGKIQEGQELLGGFDAVVHRNYFGSQLGSFSALLQSKLDTDDSHGVAQYMAVFIRAPAIHTIGKDVKVLATVKTTKASEEACDLVDKEDAIVAAEQKNILVTSFHPELTDDPTWHSYFAEFARKQFQK